MKDKIQKCFFVSDLHGRIERFEKLINEIKLEKPDVLFIGGDIYPPFYKLITMDFFRDYFLKMFSDLESEMKELYPKVFVILGNDDPKIEEHLFVETQNSGLWEYIHNKKTRYKSYDIYGFSYIPPTPFLYKDWELYDVSRYVDPGSIHPTEGKRAVEPNYDIEFTTIKNLLEKLAPDKKLRNSIFLFHSPPYKTYLDRAALDGMHFEHVPLDVHVGSIAIKDFIIEKEPLITLHGHIHESSRITGFWKEEINKTWSFNAAIDTNHLSIVVFNPENPKNAKRKIL